MNGEIRGVPVEISRMKLLLLLVGLALTAYGGYDYVQQTSAIDDAEPVEATIEEMSVSKTDGRRSHYYRVSVTFTYEYRGTTYTGDDLYPGTLDATFDTRSEAESAIEPYEENATATAYVEPATPGEGFLKRQTTQGPLKMLAGGALLVLVLTLDAVGARKPGQGTELQPVDDREPRRYQTLFGIDRDTVNDTSKRLIKLAVIAVPLSLIGVAVLLFATETGAREEPTQVGLTDPIGFLLGTAFLAIVVLIASIFLYGIWSYTEYRRLRARIPEPRPPSPFTRPTRLVSILFTNDGLDPYGTRVKRTGFAFVVALFLCGVLFEILVL